MVSLQPFPFINVYTLFEPFSFLFSLPLGSNSLQAVFTLFKWLINFNHLQWICLCKYEEVLLSEMSLGSHMVPQSTHLILLVLERSTGAWIPNAVIVRANGQFCTGVPCCDGLFCGMTTAVRTHSCLFLHRLMCFADL
jgi:hypothetical protein